jgi:hypothetical protein
MVAMIETMYGKKKYLFLFPKKSSLNIIEITIHSLNS